MIQFNGRFGCPYCLNEGETVEKGKGFVRIYKPIIGELRDARQLEANAESAVLQNKPVNGVKGYSLLLLLQIFDIIRSFVPDYMHAVLLGVVRAICELWLNSKYSNSPWYIGLRSNEVSQRLMSMKPTSEISRTPSSIDKRALWKASEWRTFLLYYSLPALRGILPEKYFRHWFLLVFAFQTLLKNKVTSSEIDAANLALQTFVKQAEILYGKEHLSFNMHLLLHMPRYVKDWGSPWASSAFMYEHGNGVLVRLFNGTQSVVDQIFRAYELTCYLQRVGPRIFNENSFEPAVKLFGKLMGDEYCVQKCSRELNNNLVIFGRAELFTAPPQVLIRIENIFRRDTFGDILRNPAVQVTSFKRFIWKNILYHCRTYQRLQKRANCVAKLLDERFIEIHRLLCVQQVGFEKHFVLFGQELIRNNGMIVRNSSLNISSTTFLASVDRGPDIYCSLDQIVGKCMLMAVDGNIYVSPLVNTFERD